MTRARDDLVAHDYEASATHVGFLAVNGDFEFPATEQDEFEFFMTVARAIATHLMKEEARIRLVSSRVVSAAFTMLALIAAIEVHAIERDSMIGVVVLVLSLEREFQANIRDSDVRIQEKGKFRS